jgi:hypothetical protein
MITAHVSAVRSALTALIELARIAEAIRATEVSWVLSRAVLDNTFGGGVAS